MSESTIIELRELREKYQTLSQKLEEANQIIASKDIFIEAQDETITKLKQQVKSYEITQEAMILALERHKMSVAVIEETS